MKFFLKTFLIFFFSVSVFFMLNSIFFKINKTDRQKEKLKQIPLFSFKTLDGKVFNNSNLNKNTYTLMVYFSTTCMYCEKQIEDIMKNHSLFQNTQILLVTKENKEAVINFRTKLELKKYEQSIILLTTNSEQFNKKFGVWNEPTIFLYNPKKQILFLNEGIIKINSILSYY